MEELPSTSGGIKRSIPQELQDEMDVRAAKLPRVTASPTVLDDNQKRYLIVGICLHSVISPALRKYVVPILTSLYTELTLNQKIDTQTYSAHLKQYQPTNTNLNYKAVNNNKAANGKSNYDYKIKSVVDLSKLFLQTPMAQYTGFDETCDSSALLGLIINIDKFPAVVKSNANNVREEVRNQWAHCNFTEWDAVKYSSSFQLMENLVKDLCLISNEKNQTLLEMKKMEINGPSSLNDTNEICRLLHVLVESSKLVAKETDNHSLEIKRLLDIAENQDTLLDSQRDDIAYWKQKDVTFVDTPVVHRISKILESEHCVLIIGEPGIGKSMLLQNVALKLQKKIEYNIIPCSGMQDILQQYKEGKRQMFVLDDICGQLTVSMPKIEQWMNDENKLRRIMNKGCTKVAATCRLDIYNNEKFQKSYTVFKSNICNLSVEYSREDKLAICKHYLSKTNIQLLKDQNVDFTPLMCSLYSQNENFNLTNFLQCPFKTYHEEWDKLKSFDKYKYCSLFLCVIYNGIMKDSLFDIDNENNTKNKAVLKIIFEICGLSRGTSRWEIKAVLDSMIGTYVRKTKNEYRVIHDQMFDFMCCYFGNTDTMVKCILRYSDIRVSNERTQLESVNEQHGKFSIMIPKNYEKEYFKRIKRDLQLGKLNQCFYNTHMKYVVYRTSFLEILKAIDDKLDIAQIYKTKKMRSNPKYADSIEALECDNCSADDADDDDEKYLKEGPFIASCLQGYYDMFQYFISKSDDIQNCDSIHTPLTAACKGGNEKIVQILLDKGSNVDQVSSWYQTPLTAACDGGNENIVQLLIDKGSDVNQDGFLLDTPLTAACQGGNEKIVQLLIDEGSVVNAEDYIGHTPLTAACSEGHEKIVQLLIYNGGDVNQVAKFEQTPLTAACSEGHEKIVKLLIDNGSYVNQVIDMEQTPLTIACNRGDEKIVQLLIDKGSEVNQTDGMGQEPLTTACMGENKKIVQLLIDKGSDVNHVCGKGMTPLTAACEGGNEEIVQILIDNGSEVNQADDFGQTPLTVACGEENKKIVQLLLDKGCDVNKASSDGDTPLTISCMVENEEIAQLLIDKGCDVNKVNGNRNTPLSISCFAPNVKIVQLLVDKGCDVNQAHSNEETPLTISCIYKIEKIVQLLIDNGCDVNQVDCYGRTPLTIACKEGNEKIVQLLIDKGSEVNKISGKGQTPLTVACRNGNEKIVRLLLDKGCDVNMADADGETPLTISRMVENKKIVQLLIDKEREVDQADTHHDMNRR